MNNEEIKAKIKTTIQSYEKWLGECESANLPETGEIPQFYMGKWAMAFHDILRNADIIANHFKPGSIQEEKVRDTAKRLQEAIESKNFWHIMVAMIPLHDSFWFCLNHLASPLVSGQSVQAKAGGAGENQLNDTVVRIKIANLGKKQGKHVALLKELSASAENRVKIDPQRHGKDPLRVFRRCKAINSKLFHEARGYIYCEKKVVLE
jgi:hypothetical protein